MTVHCAIYVTRQWHPTKQPEIERDGYVQEGEIISLWEPVPGVPDEDNWPRWHIDNPHVLRVIIEGVTAEQAAWIAAPWVIPLVDNAFGGHLVAKRLWRFDIQDMIAEEEARLGRPLNLVTDILVVDAVRRAQWINRAEFGGKMRNKAAGDLPLNNSDRAKGAVRARAI